MRHIPTSIYIDTEFFYRQGLRFDTKVFTTLRTTFVKGGLRLLVPAMMERELFRHFKRNAEKVAYAVIKAHGEYPINKIAIAEIPSREELENKCIEEMSHQWTLFKEHFVVENLPITGSLAEVVDWYFDVRPPFSGKKSKEKEFPDAFILSALDQYHKQHNVNIAVIGKDGDFEQACVSRRYILYLSDIEKYIEMLEPEISGKEMLPEESIDLTKPIVTEDLAELKAILGRGEQATSIEIQRVINLLPSRGSNYDYFFKNANAVIWLSPLSEKGYFLNPPNVEKTSDGREIIHLWPPLNYLVRVFEADPKKVLGEVAKIPRTENPRVLQDILRIILKADSVQTVLKFSSHIISFIEYYRWGHGLIIELLNKPFFFDALLTDAAPAILLKLVEFRPDPREQEKRIQRKENPNTWGSSLEPAPRLKEWEYRQILEKGVRPLAEIEPYQVARILIDATASMIRLGIHPEDLDKRGDEDHSEAWCPLLDKPDRDFQDSREALVHTMTYACEQVFKKTPGSIEALDQALRNQRWKVFKRLRQHLYALYPNDQTLPWIREFILTHEDYPRWEHHFEFQLMVRKACEHFGPRLLSEAEKETIFKTILNGPPKDDFREWMGERYSEEAFQKRQRYFHQMQLRPFATLLTGDYQRYFDELEQEHQEKPLSDESYSPHRGISSGPVTYRSPKSIEELAVFTDDELLSYLNNWDNEQSDKSNLFVEINIAALADVFKSLFKETIVPDEKRLAFWLANYVNIERPIYVTFMAKAMQEIVRDKNFEKLGQWIAFCAWIVSHPDANRKEGETVPREDSREHPDWGRSRSAVVDFIDTCLDKGVNAPISARDGLVGLIHNLCTGFDWRLDRGHPVLLNRDDPIMEAINSTRSQALRDLFHFGYWVRRYLPEDTVPEVTEILRERIEEGANVKLTRPEQALLGMHFGDLCILNQAWAVNNKNAFFPQDNMAVWRAAFGSFIKYNQPGRPTFDILRADFEFALDHLEAFDGDDGLGEKLIDRIGQHLFSYYLWEVYPLKGEESLLSRFYEKTTGDRKRWAHLFDHIGRSLRNSGKHLEKSLVDRIIAFFKWRFETGETQELRKFTYWLKAECLEPAWRLDAYSRILDLGQIKNDDVSTEIKTLAELLPDHMPQVVECFAKITDSIDQDSNFFIFAEDATPILKTGLNSDDPQIQEMAARARENLLRLGRFDFLDV